MLALGVPPGHLRDEVRVEARVPSGRDREVPGVDEVVDRELVDVLADLLLAVRQVDDAAGRQSFGHRGGGLPGGLAGPARRVVAEQVAVEAGADVGDRPAVDERSGPPVLADDVVDQLADRPPAAGRLRRPS